MPKKLLLASVFVFLTAETEGIVYTEHLWAPMSLFRWFAMQLPIKLTGFEIICWLLLLGGRRPPNAARARPVLRAIHLSMGAILAGVVYGLATGGQFKPMYTQVHMWICGLLFALTASKLLISVADFERLGRVIVLAALYRSVMAILCYFTLRGGEMPAFLTSHEDTVLFVVGLLIVVSRAIELRTRQAVRQLLAVAPVILLAIQFNNRRLAWASLVAGLLVLYFMLPAKTKARRKANRIVAMAAPVLLVYIAVGWGRPERIFKPLAAFSTMGAGKVDPSTKARDNENVGMVLMLLDKPLLGPGLGHQWLEVDSTYTVPSSVFPMYRYSPHNSVLALLAFYGGIGFVALWLVFPTSVYLNARAYRLSTNPAERSVAAVALVQVVVWMNQMWGDMGLVCGTPATIVGGAVAAAARISVTSGAWSSAKAVRSGGELPARPAENTGSAT